MRSPAALLALLATSSSALADDVDDLVAAGEALAKSGEYTRAIGVFKQADAKRPRALHACLIALSYTRRELWAQAEIALAACHARAGGADPLPTWVGELDQTFAEKLRAVEVAPITFRVEPPVPGTRLSIFSPDETFEPRVLHLAPGTYTVTATAPGRDRVTTTIVIADRTPRTVTLQVSPTVTRSKVPWILVGAGGVLAASGLVYDLAAVQPVRKKMRSAAEAGDLPAWTEQESIFARRRALAIGLFAGGAIAAGAGVALRFTVYRREVVIAPGPGGVALVGAM